LKQIYIESIDQTEKLFMLNERKESITNDTRK